MLFIERKPGFPLRRFVRSLWSANTPFVKHWRERILPTGCAHIVVSCLGTFSLTARKVDRTSAPLRPSWSGNVRCTRSSAPRIL